MFINVRINLEDDLSTFLADIEYSSVSIYEGGSKWYRIEFTNLEDATLFTLKYSDNDVTSLYSDIRLDNHPTYIL